MSDRRQGRNQPAAEPSALYSEKAERMVIGTALQDQNFFWDCHGKLKLQYFAVPRLARIWDAMARAVTNGKQPTKTWVPLYIQGDSSEEVPLLFFLNLLVNDANEEGQEHAPIHADTVITLANKRSVLDALEAAKQKILKSEFGTAPEHLQDMAMKAIATSIDADYDKDMRGYEEWADEAFRETAANVDRDDDEMGGIGLSCGLAGVEDVIGRLLPGKVYILAGMSGSGKSALARQILEAAALDAQRRNMGASYVGSLEMTGKEYAIRSLSERMGIPADQIEKGAIERALVERMGHYASDMRKYNIVIDSKPGMTIDEMKARAIKTKVKRGGLALMVIDHLVIIGAEKGETMFDKVTNATMKAKNMAKELEIPIIVLAQLNEKKILETASGWPNASHLFGGETITQNADVIAFIHRHELVLSKKEPATNTEAHDKWVGRMGAARGKAHFFNDKRRGGAGRVSRELRFDGPTMHFEDI